MSAQYEAPTGWQRHPPCDDQTCVFPFCTRPASGRRPGEHDADCDHITPEDPDHRCRADLHLQPRAAVPPPPPDEDPRRLALPAVERGTYLWTAPSGYRFLRDHDGTLDVTRDRPPAPAPTHPTPDARAHTPPTLGGVIGMLTGWSRCDRRRWAVPLVEV